MLMHSGDGFQGDSRDVDRIRDTELKLAMVFANSINAPRIRPIREVYPEMAVSLEPSLRRDVTELFAPFERTTGERPAT